MTDIESAEHSMERDYREDLEREVVDLRARLAEVEAERDRRTSAFYWLGITAENADLRARLAEVEAERDRQVRMRDAFASDMEEWQARAEAAEAEVREYRSAITWNTTCLSCSKVLDSAYEQTARAEAAEARLAEVEALCDERWWDKSVFVPQVRAAARGEGDRLDASLRYIAERDAELLRRLGEGGDRA